VTSPNNTTQLAVIGAGPGGYTAAFRAADLGMDVTLIDPEPNPGGACLYRGCIPSKALLHVAAFIQEARQAPDWGVSVGEIQVDVDKLRDWKRGVVNKLTAGVGQLCKQRKIEYIQGRARFENNTCLTIETVDGGSQTLIFEHAVLATGARPMRFPAMIDSPRVMTSKEALDIEDAPGRLLVIGGGYIGLELGQVYAALGSKVTVVEMMSVLLPGADPDLVRPLQKKIDATFHAVRLDTKVTEIHEEEDGLSVSFQKQDGSVVEDIFDKVLVAVGRQPWTKDTGVENTRIEADNRGFVEVDLQMRTAEPNVFAIGDIVGQPMLAHKASHEAIVAVEAIKGKKTVFEPRAIPAVVFTDPEVAWCGLTETEATQMGREVRILKFPWAASGRAVTFDRTDGITKLIVDSPDGRILGVGITGVHAGELIAQGVQAIELGAIAEDLALTIHTHPTLSETLMETAQSFAGQSTHYLGRKKK
jgi:dihydrolipoamide dehydrogenase